MSIAALMDPLPKVDTMPPPTHKNITVVNGYVKPEYETLPSEYRMISLDEMVEKSLKIVQNLVVIPGAMVRCMPVITVRRGHVGVRLRIFVPK